MGFLTSRNGYLLTTAEVINFQSVSQSGTHSDSQGPTPQTETISQSASCFCAFCDSFDYIEDPLTTFWTTDHWKATGSQAELDVRPVGSETANFGAWHRYVVCGPDMEAYIDIGKVPVVSWQRRYHVTLRGNAAHTIYYHAYWKRVGNGTPDLVIAKTVSGVDTTLATRTTSVTDPTRLTFAAQGTSLFAEITDGGTTETLFVGDDSITTGNDTNFFVGVSGANTDVTFVVTKFCVNCQVTADMCYNLHQDDLTGGLDTSVSSFAGSGAFQNDRYELSAASTGTITMTAVCCESDMHVQSIYDSTTGTFDTDDFQLLLYARANVGFSEYYRAKMRTAINAGTSSDDLRERHGGVTTTLATNSPGGGDGTWKLETIGTAIKLYKGGVQQLSVVDANVSGHKYARWQAVSSANYVSGFGTVDDLEVQAL